MSHEAIAFAVGFFVGACLMVIAVGLGFALRCARCKAEIERYLRVKDAQ